MVDKPIECTTPRVNPKVNKGLWVIMMCQWRFILSEKKTILVSYIDNGGSCVYWNTPKHCITFSILKECQC